MAIENLNFLLHSARKLLKEQYRDAHVRDLHLNLKRYHNDLSSLPISNMNGVVNQRQPGKSSETSIYKPLCV